MQLPTAGHCGWSNLWCVFHRGAARFEIPCLALPLKHSSFLSVVPIDGRYNILGSAGPIAFRADGEWLITWGGWPCEFDGFDHWPDQVDYRLAHCHTHA